MLPAMIGISPRQLEVFVAVAATGSVRAAAEQLHLTQPAASMALAGMERRIGVELFDRARQRLHLNARGRALLPQAREVLARLQALERSATAGPEELMGELRIGASNTVGSYRVGELLGGFIAQYPQASVQLVVDNTHTVLERVLDYSLDLGCVEGPAARAGLEVLPWREDALAVCARPNHPLALRRRLQAADFAGMRWILREHGSATRALVERELTRLPGGVTVMELGNSEAIKQAVLAGLGMACLPLVAVRAELAAGELKVLRTPFLDLSRQLSLVLARGRYRGPLLQALLDTAQAAPPNAAAASATGTATGAHARARGKRRKTRASG